MSEQLCITEKASNTGTRLGDSGCSSRDTYQNLNMELPLYWFNSTLPKAFGRNIYFLTKREGKGVFKKKQFSLSNILNHYIAINFFKKLNDLYVTHGFQCDWIEKET